MRISNAIIRLLKTANVDILPTSVSVNPGVSVATPETGYTYARIQRILALDPEVSFSTEELKAVLDETGITGTCIKAGGTVTGLEIYGQRHDGCTAGGRSSASDHFKHAISEGQIFLQSLRGNANQPAVAQMMVYAISSDGVTDPQSQVYNVAAIPTQPQGTQYIAGNCKVGNIYLDRILSIEVALNTDAQRVRYAGSLWPKLIDIMRVPLVVRIQTDKLDVIGTGGSQIPHTGLDITHANSFVQFLKKKQGGGGVELAATAVHIKGTMAGMAYASQQYDANGNATGVANIDIPLIYDGTNVPIVWNTASAYALS